MEEPITLQQMLNAMSNQGWRVTNQRRWLATLFVKTEGYLSPKDVYEHMIEKYPNVSFDTVYRNLRLLSEMGVLEQFYYKDGLKFRANCLSHHHHHMICLNCEKTFTFEFCPMTQLPELSKDFHIMNHRFDIFGLCNDCEPVSTVQLLQ